MNITLVSTDKRVVTIYRSGSKNTGMCVRVSLSAAGTVDVAKSVMVFRPEDTWVEGTFCKGALRLEPVPKRVNSALRTSVDTLLQIVMPDMGCAPHPVPNFNPTYVSAPPWGNSFQQPVPFMNVPLAPLHTRFMAVVKEEDDKEIRVTQRGYPTEASIVPPWAMSSWGMFNAPLSADEEDVLNLILA